MGSVRVVELTPREMETAIRLLEDGSDYETVGRRMGVTINTVKTHTRNIYKKAEVPNRVALVLAVGRREILLKETFRPTLTKPMPRPSVLVPEDDPL